MTMRAKLRSLAPGHAGHAGFKGTGAVRPAVRSPQPHERSDPDTFEWRGSDGPVDVGHYACACGFQFAASVGTTVRCPHCGAGQAW
jgi:hypothetical protein